MTHRRVKRFFTNRRASFTKAHAFDRMDREPAEEDSALFQDESTPQNNNPRDRPENRNE